MLTKIAIGFAVLGVGTLGYIIVKARDMEDEQIKNSLGFMAGCMIMYPVLMLTNTAINK